MELLSHLLPAPDSLQLASWALDDAHAEITLTLISRQAATPCPACTAPATRVHSRYRRTLTDLPWGTFTVRLQLQVRKLFCDQPGCTRRIFAERLPAVAAPWARRTARLGTRPTALGLALGGAPGARPARVLGMATTRNTLLRLIRAAPPPPEVNRAQRKRHRYGTVLVDLERRRPVALLPDREADTLARWLQAHPGVKIVARDRSGAYADGIRRGAPQAAQVADRFHLLQNLTETLATVLTGHAAALRAVEQPERGGGTAVRPAPPPPQPTALAKAAERREQRLAKYRQVWRLHREGWPGGAIARQLGLGRSTVTRYLRSEAFPERKQRHDRGRSLLDRWKPFILEPWNAGRRNSRELMRALRQRGYRGSYPTLARYTQRLRQAQEDAAEPGPASGPRALPAVIDPPRRAFTARTAAWLAVRRPEQRHADDTARLARLRAQHAGVAEAIDLAEAFAALVRAGRAECLDPWLARAQAGAVPAFRGFAKRLRLDEDAVRAAVTSPWSTGQVEGQINRLVWALGVKVEMMATSTFLHSRRGHAVKGAAAQRCRRHP